jgi:hypothetical protein
MPKFSGFGYTFLNGAVKANFSHLSSPLFKRSIVDKVGNFNNSIIAVADHHFLQRCVIANAHFIYYDMPETLSLVRWHMNNMSKNAMFMKKELIKANEKLIPLLDQRTETIEILKNANKSLKLDIQGSWKKFLLSGGPFDKVKRILRWVGLEKIAKKIFYKSK